MLDLTVIILTFNEGKHLGRAISSLKNCAARIIVMDSFSTDNTEQIARDYGADFFQKSWVNYASQFNYALSSTKITTQWVMRLDADEYLDFDLYESLVRTLSSEIQCDGYVLNRRICFMGKKLNHGGMGGYYMLRVWRNGLANCEQRWMDEHMLLKSENIDKLEGTLVDENINSIHWWINKHNIYAAREAVDVLMSSIKEEDSHDIDLNLAYGNSARRKLKKAYLSLPTVIRSPIYFMYRYVFLLGFLDGYPGLCWCFLQGFWYRFLVDLKVSEIKRVLEKSGSDEAIAFVRKEYSLRL